ncbi:MAG TPA: 3-deoxy-8-phosphooctulonate synthase [Nitrospiria bacterium]|nr:3-deoxy-8-phosphooctulonate synthase [Nitrospiria bacterium]
MAKKTTSESHPSLSGIFDQTGSAPLFLIAGPCVIESESVVLETAREIQLITRELSIPFIFKSSYDKANRSSVNSFRGPGLRKGLKVLEKVKSKLNLPVLSDIHQAGDAAEAAAVLDVLQIPAFLCRQTDILTSAGKTGKIVNVKKGQFMAPWEMKNVVGKLESTGNKKIILTDRGSTFGYNNLVSDMRAIPIMQELGYPVVFDATHSVQLPGAGGERSTGQSEFIAPLARAAVAAGCNGIFAEVHPEPAKALSDGPNMLPLKNLRTLLKTLQSIHEVLGKEGQ